MTQTDGSFNHVMIVLPTYSINWSQQIQGSCVVTNRQYISTNFEEAARSHNKRVPNRINLYKLRSRRPGSFNRQLPAAPPSKRPHRAKQ